MPDSSYFGFVGDADFHDGSILAVERQDDSVRVRIRGASGRNFVVSFGGVRAVRANSPEGMVLYALTEFIAVSPVQRFVFANWDDDGEATLEVDAEGLAINED